MNLYELKDLTLVRSGRFTLEIADFTLETNEKVAVVGQNGAGKTTLLRLLAFLEKPSSWKKFAYMNREYAPGRMDRNGLGFLKQQPYLFSGTVYQNTAYPLKLRGLARPELSERVRSMLETVDLLPLADAQARRLSGGEQKRLALGRVLIGQPKLLLLDEPTAHLDRRSRTIIERVLARTAATILLTTHDLHFAHRIAGRVLNLKAGRISPSLPENVLEGRREGDALVTAGGLRIHLPPEAAPRGAATLTVMIDPRALVLSREPLSSSMRNRFRGQVCSVQGQGHNVWLEIDCGDRLMAIITRASYEKLGINLHRDVVVSFKAHAVEVL